MKLMSMKPQFCYVHPKIYQNKIKNEKFSVQPKSSQNSSQKNKVQKNMKFGEQIIEFEQKEIMTIKTTVQSNKTLSFIHQSYEVFDRIEKTYMTINFHLIISNSSNKSLPENSLQKKDQVIEQDQSVRMSSELAPQYIRSTKRRQSPPMWSQSIKQLKTSAKC